MATADDLKAVDARVGRLEAKVEAQQSDIGEVKVSVAWIKGYLETNGNGPKRQPVRDSALVVGGGGGTAGLLFVLEKIFGG